MKQLIKKIIPISVINQYHRLLAIFANFFYGHPSDKMVVIGVTGTNGKSTTVMLIAKILEAAGHKVGATSTAIFKIADKEWLNDKKMTMLGRFALQKLLKEMMGAGCEYAVIETSSQGIDQYRHWGINYDAAVFTNLTPEHIEAHGGFENYKKAKEKLFAKLKTEKKKVVGGREVKKIIIANADDEHAAEFLNYWADEKYVFGIAENEQVKSQKSKVKSKEIFAEDIIFRPDGVSFKIGTTDFSLKLFGQFNVYNALAAIAAAQAQCVDLLVCKNVLEKVSGVPGRMEMINENQTFKVIVDYAPEPESLRQAYQTIRDHRIITQGRKMIHVLGSCGGGRDTARRPILGDLAARNADCVIVTNEDPYDDNPEMIINQVADSALKAGKVLNSSLFKIQDRREAISKALSLADAGDLVLLTGKGCEQAICVANGKKIPWDEREVAREELKKLKA